MNFGHTTSSQVITKLLLITDKNHEKYFKTLMQYN